MRTLVYKRTHTGDPNEHGVFGCNDCMGEVRGWDFEAVIGVGGQGHEAEKNGIAMKVNWIGIGPHKENVARFRGRLVAFRHFKDFDREGTDIWLEIEAPNLAKRMYTKKPRVVMTFTPQEREEIDRLLALAKAAHPSSALTQESRSKKRTVCRTKYQHAKC